MPSTHDAVPTIDVSPLFDGTLLSSSGSSQAAANTARAIHDACKTYGFFQVVNTNMPDTLIKSLEDAMERFFALPEDKKLALHVQNGGPAWRGYMPWGGEGTKGRLDLKEGFYGGPEHDVSHPLYGAPLHGQNQFPDDAIPEMRDYTSSCHSSIYDAAVTALPKRPSHQSQKYEYLRGNYDNTGAAHAHFMTPFRLTTMRCDITQLESCEL